MALAQIRDVRAGVVEGLKTQAAERGVTLAGYLQVELTTMASRPTNAEVISRIVARGDTRIIPGAAVASIRELRDSL